MNRRTRADRGSIIPIVGLSMVAIITVLAIVIDLGYTRAVRQQTRSASDAGSTSGAVALADAANAVVACEDALAYTFKSLGTSDPSAASIASACASFASACVATSARTASLTHESYAVTVKNPVPDTDPLMNATVLGSGVSQTLNSNVDGVACDRVGVQIIAPQGSFFRGIVGSTATTYTVHSVALHITKPGRGETTPALVALNQSACKAIDAGNGVIYLIGNTNGPGIAYSDSNGPSCNSANPIISGGSSGQVCAQSSSVVGQLGWFEAPNSRGYNTSSPVYGNADAVCGTGSLSSYRYVGSLIARTKRVTREPIDLIYRCSTTEDSNGDFCDVTEDAVQQMETLSNNSTASAPSGFATFTDCNNSSGVTLNVDTWVNCPTYSVKGGTVSVAGGVTVIFNGALSVEAGGDLRVNATTAVDVNGYPTPVDSTKQSRIIINSSGGDAFSMQSTSANIRMAQTAVYNKGGMSISGSPVIRWTPPTAGITSGLLYWSESSQQFGLSGGPSIFAKGVFFQGNGKLFVSGGGLIDLQKVQMWVDTIGISGGGGVKLSADPTTAISTDSPASALIR